MKRLYKTCPKCGCARFNTAVGACSACGYAKPKPAPAVTLPQRHPLAFGITYWGPLPDTQDCHVMWNGPGDGLYYYPFDPTSERAARMPGLCTRITHASACGTYATVKEAEKALAAFIAAGPADD